MEKFSERNGTRIAERSIITEEKYVFTQIIPEHTGEHTGETSQV